MKHFISVALLLACALSSSSILFAEGSAAPKYSIEAVRTAPESDEVIIRLAAAKEWHLNGEGYPEIVVTVELSGSPVDLSCAGVAENAKQEWTMRVPRGTVEIPVEIEAIACGNSRCLPIREKKVMPVFPRD